MHRKNPFAKLYSTQAKILKKALLPDHLKAAVQPVQPIEEVAAPVVINEPVVSVIEPAAPLPEAKVIKLPSLEDIQDVLSDMISFELLKNDPVITPFGNTYNRSTFDHLNFDPKAKDSPCDRNKLLSNKLVSELAAYYEHPSVDLTQAAPGLICPETGGLFVSPVVASNGKTYEAAWINTYLGTTGGKLPTGEDQLSFLYPNRVVKSLINELKDCLRAVQAAEPELIICYNNKK